MNRVELCSRGESLLFDCPGCEQLHAVRVKANAGPVWTWNGSLESPTVSPSVLVRWTHGEEHKPMVCHSFIRDGRIEFLADCTHAKAGQTVELMGLLP